MTGEDPITIKTKLYNINEDYILVFVDGLYTRNWKYRTNGSIVLNDKPKQSYEVYILKPYDYNSQDMVVRGSSSFTFNNMRLNPYIKGGETNIINHNMLITSTDLLFVEREIKMLSQLKQDMSFLRKYIVNNLDAKPNIMLHYTMDRLMRDGTFDVFPYASNELTPEMEEELPADGNMNYILKLESKFNRYATMLFDNEGLLINPMSISWGVPEFSIPQLTKRITAVCLNGGQPAIVGDFINTNQVQLLVGETNILNEISLTKLDMEVIENIDILQDVVRDPNTYETGLMEEIGTTDYIYNKISDVAQNTLYAPEDEFIPENIFMFVNGKKVFKDDLEINEENKCYIIHNEDKYTNSRWFTNELGNLTENDIIMMMGHNFSAIGNTDSESDALYVKDEILIDDMEDFTQRTDVIHKIENSKECVVFQYNADDLFYTIEEKLPSSRNFILPEVGYMKDNILVFKNGIKTTDYSINGDVLKLNGDDIIDTVEIYVFKKLDYLFVDDNKYNQNCYNFIVKNIKRSIFF